ncbi:hypothetical protein HDU67_003531, partial [Dinochytrium kinnereticum]
DASRHHDGWGHDLRATRRGVVEAEDRVSERVSVEVDHGYLQRYHEAHLGQGRTASAAPCTNRATTRVASRAKVTVCSHYSDLLRISKNRYSMVRRYLFCIRTATCRIPYGNWPASVRRPDSISTAFVGNRPAGIHTKTTGLYPSGRSTAFNGNLDVPYGSVLNPY